MLFVLPRPVTQVTQHPTPPAQTWGVAYHFPAAAVEQAREYLDLREINGYSIQHTLFHPVDPSRPPFDCLVYIGLPHNPQFIGPQDPAELAAHISRSRGPSGTNLEYLYQLETALHSLGSSDDHVTDLARRCRQLE